MSTTARVALADLWRGLAMPPGALSQVELTGADPVVPSTFAVGAAAQASMAAAVLAAAELWRLRTGRRQTARVDMQAAALECFCHFSIDGVVPPTWDKLSQTPPRWSRLSMPPGAHPAQWPAA